LSSDESSSVFRRKIPPPSSGSKTMSNILSCLLSLLCSPEDGNNTLLRNTSKRLPDYMASHPESWCLQGRLVGHTACYLHEADPFLRNRQFWTYSRTSLHFMEPEGPMLSQITTAYTTPSFLCKIHSHIVLPSTSRSASGARDEKLIHNSVVKTLKWEPLSPRPFTALYLQN
jgi:hypothetical protein